MRRCCPILELRQYTLHSGRRETLIELFEREFVESQEILGMRIVGQFRDAHDENRFVWLRGFADMASRFAALHAFYSGPVWKRHSEAANATMVDSDNVLLLRPAHESSGFLLDGVDRPPIGETAVTAGTVYATIHHFKTPLAAESIERCVRSTARAAKYAGVTLLASFVTDPSPNNYPALPIRDREHVFVSFSTVALEARDIDAVRKIEVLKLEPTSRSLLRG